MPLTPKKSEEFCQRSISKGNDPSHFTTFKNLKLSKLGMGTYLGDPSPHIDELLSQAILKSVKSGVINVIDTAINYRSQLSERTIGNVLNNLSGEIKRDHLFISTKNGYIPGDAHNNISRSDYLNRIIDDGIVKKEDIVQGVHCMSINFLKYQLQTSLNNLQIDTVDLMYLHNSAESQIPEIGKERYFDKLRNVFEFYESRRDKGTVNHYGLATWDSFRADQGGQKHVNLEDVVKIAEEVAGKENGFNFVQLPLNLAMPEALTKQNQKINGENVSFIEAANRLNIGVFTSVPLLQTKLLEQELPTATGYSKSQICLEFVRSIPEIIAPLVGHKQPSHVSENLEMGNKPVLNPDEYRDLFFN